MKLALAELTNPKGAGAPWECVQVYHAITFGNTAILMEQWSRLPVKAVFCYAILQHGMYECFFVGTVFLLFG